MLEISTNVSRLTVLLLLISMVSSKSMVPKLLLNTSDKAAQTTSVVRVLKLKKLFVSIIFGGVFVGVMSSRIESSVKT